MVKMSNVGRFHWHSIENSQTKKKVKIHISWFMRSLNLARINSSEGNQNQSFSLDLFLKWIHENFQSESTYLCSCSIWIWMDRVLMKSHNDDIIFCSDRIFVGRIENIPAIQAKFKFYRYYQKIAKLYGCV